MVEELEVLELAKIYSFKNKTKTRIWTSLAQLYLSSLSLREAFNKKNIFFVKNVTKGLPPPLCDKKPFTFFGQKWSFQEVKILYFNLAIICQSLQPFFVNFLAKIPLCKPL